MMKRIRGIRENLTVALGISIVASLVVVAAFLVETISTRRESVDLASLSGAAVQGKPIIIGDRDFSRIYRIRSKGRDLFGIVLRIKSRSGTALVATLFTADGKLDAAALLGETSSRMPWSAPGWFANFLGKDSGDSIPGFRDSSRKPDLITGATESFMDSAEALKRVSNAIQAIPKEAK
jgi:hypothetical protein